MHCMPSRLPPVGLVCATLIALAACGGNGAAATPSVAAATPSAAAAKPSAVAAKPSAGTASSVAGSRFTSKVFAVPISFSLAGGWKVNLEGGSNIDLGRDDHGASAGPFHSFTGGIQDVGIQDIGSTTVAGATPSDPYLPWPKDMYAWPKAISVGGRPATQIDADVNVPVGTRIELVCSNGSNCWLLDHNDRWRFVEVKKSDGSGVVWISNGIPAPGFDAYAQALDQLLGTFEFR